MTAFLKRFRIRTRLLVVYLLILFLGFGALTAVAGQQISAAARQDFEQRLKSEIALIAQGLSTSIHDYVDNRISEADLQAAFDAYVADSDGTLTLVSLQNERFSEDDPQSGRMSFRDQSELETALRGEISIDERRNDAGEDALYTASQINYEGRTQGLLQLSVPARNLQQMIAERWLELLLIFGLVGLLGSGAAFWLARSIIQPLDKLRESALRLSLGDFSHRVAYNNSDEIGDVARAFNEMAVEVESMLEEQRAFASNTSHELRTPLTTIRLRTEALRYDATLEPEIAKQYINEIDDEVSRLGNLIQDLTLLSRFDAGRTELGNEQIDMERFAVSLRDQVLQLAREKNIQIILVPPTKTLTISASINHVSVLFRNLLDNAIKYTPKNGEITWTIEEVAAGVQHTITDTGQGIEAEHLPHLFERFFRIDKARSRAVPGTGLGLALVKSIVDAYGGTITIVSKGLDQGASVTVILPLTQNA